MAEKHRTCPACGSPRSKVIEPRDEPRTVRDQLVWSGNGYWRRRECLDCHRTYTTEETVTALDPPSASTG